MAEAANGSHDRVNFACPVQGASVPARSVNNSDAVRRPKLTCHSNKRRARGKLDRVPGRFRKACPPTAQIFSSTNFKTVFT